MRKPRMTRVKKSPEFPDGRKYTGSVEYRGVSRWVKGAYPSSTAWKEAAEKVVDEIRTELSEQRLGGPAGPVKVPTVGEFTGLTVRDGRVVPREGKDITATWPWTHTREGKLGKESSKRRYSEALRRFIRLHENAPMNRFSRTAAKAWQQDAGQHEREAVRRLFSDALDDEVITGANPFRGAGSKKKRKDDPDFEVASDELFERFLSCALGSRSDDYAHVLHAMVLLEGQSGMRPSEIFGQHHDDVHAEEGYIDVFWQIDDRGARVPVKNELRRKVPMSPRMVRSYEAMPHISHIAFPAPRGGYFKLSSWHSHWKAIRTAAGRPEFEFYELKHRAITWLITPRESGGLGVDLPTAAYIVGHQDGGITIAKHYLKLAENAAVDRVRKAMAIHEGEPHLRVVGE